MPEQEPHEAVFAACFVEGWRISVDLHIYGKEVTPGSPTKQLREKVESKRTQKIAQKNLDRYFSSGSLYSWASPTKEGRRAAAEGMRLQEEKRKVAAARIQARASEASARAKKPLNARPPLKEWRREEVADVLNVFFEYDEDASGFID